MDTKDSRLRVVLVDDHTLLRTGLKMLLEMDGAARVVGEASDALEGLERVSGTPCDVVVIDLSLPGHDGIWCTQAIRKTWPRLPVVVLTMHVDEELVVGALRAGANGYVIKSASYRELVHALHQVTEGGSYIDPRVAGQVIRELRIGPSEPETDDAPLTSRELELLALVTHGFKNREIAARLNVTLNTVKSHMRSIRRKLSAADKAQAVARALRLGLIPEQPCQEPELVGRG